MSKPSDQLHEIVTPECRDAFDAGHAAFDGASHFVESPYFNDNSETGELLGRFWVDGHVRAIKDAANNITFNHNKEQHNESSNPV